MTSQASVESSDISVTKLSVFSAVALAATALIAIWAANNLTTSAVGSAGFILTAVGLIVSILGFGFTIWQLRKTQSAASAASIAISRLRKDFGAIDLVSELGAAKSAADEAHQNLQEKRWSSALLNMKRLHQSLSKILVIDRNFLGSDVEKVKDFTADALGACSSLQPIPSDDWDFSALGNKLIEMGGQFVQMEYRVRGEFSGQ